MRTPPRWLCVACTRICWRSQTRTMAAPSCASSTSRRPARTANVVSVCCCRASASATAAMPRNMPVPRSGAGALDRAGTPEHIDLPAHRALELVAEVRIAGVGAERGARIFDGAIDRLQAALDDVYGGRVELRATLLQRR